MELNTHMSAHKTDEIWRGWWIISMSISRVYCYTTVMLDVIIAGKQGEGYIGSLCILPYNRIKFIII